MTNYTQNTFFAPKDALPALDPDKLILGVDLDAELLELQTVSATKFDTAFIATQAQAEAGISNTVLMTPLRTLQFIGDAGGGGAGIVVDLIALTDPGDDRILFWDESIDAAAYLDIGTHLETTAGAVLNVTEATIDHDALLNFFSDEHIDHTTVSALAGSAITITGVDISADFTIALDIDGLTVLTSLQVTADKVVVFDSSAGANVGVTLDNLVGALLGDGKWFRGANQATAAGVELTVVYNTANYDALEVGTFSIATGEYTAGGNGGRVYVEATVRVDTIKDDEVLNIKIQVDGVTQADNINTNAGNVLASTDRTITVGTVLSLTASQVVRVRTSKTGTADSILSGVDFSYISVIELSAAP